MTFPDPQQSDSPDKPDVGCLEHGHIGSDRETVEDGDEQHQVGEDDQHPSGRHHAGACTKLGTSL